MSTHNDPRLRDESAVSRYSRSHNYDPVANQYAHVESANVNLRYTAVQAPQQLEQQQQQQQRPIVNYSSALQSDYYTAGTWSTEAAVAAATALSPHDEYSLSKSKQSAASNAKTYENFKNEAVALEAQKQKEAFYNQRDEYVRKAKLLKNELKSLRLQTRELNSDNLNSRVLRENSKLQSEIYDKLKSIVKVIDMLTGLIGDRIENVDYDSDSIFEYGDGFNGASSSKDVISKGTSPTRSHSNQHMTPSRCNSVAAQAAAVAGAAPVSPKICSSRNVKFNYVHYDPEIHWCSVCNMFPKSAKDYLNHLHSHEHRVMIHEKQLNEAPWHKLPCEQEIPTNKDGPIKRIPIKGLQFFLSATAWYCKLCDQWIGDLHCASVHLKSRNHAHNYLDFTEYNPHWESDWMSDREKALEKSLITFNEKKQEEKQQSQNPQQAAFFNRDSERRQTDFHATAAEAAAASSVTASSSLQSLASASHLNENRVSQSYLDAEGRPLTSHKRSKATVISLSSPKKSSKKKKKRRRQLASKEKRKKSKKSKKRKKSSTTKSSRNSDDDDDDKDDDKDGYSHVSSNDRDYYNNNENSNSSTSSSSSSGSSESSDLDSDSGSDSRHAEMRSSRLSGTKRDTSDRSKSIRVAMRNKSKSSQSKSSVILNEEINDQFANAAYLSREGTQTADFLKFTATKETIVGERTAKEPETHYINQWTKISEPADKSFRMKGQEHKTNIAMEIRKPEIDASKLRKYRSNDSASGGSTKSCSRSRSRNRSRSCSRNSTIRSVHRRRSNTKSRSRTRSRTCTRSRTRSCSPRRTYRSYRSRYSSKNYTSSRSRSRSRSYVRRDRGDRYRDRDRDHDKDWDGNRNRSHRHDRDRDKNKNNKISLNECSSRSEDNASKLKLNPNAFNCIETHSESEFPLNAPKQPITNISAASATIATEVTTTATASTTTHPSGCTFGPFFKKLPFIGRMPLKKKRIDLEEVKKESVNVMEFRESRFTDDVSVKNIIPKPGVANITKLATPIDEHEHIIKRTKAEEDQRTGAKVTSLVPPSSSKVITVESPSVQMSTLFHPVSLPVLTKPFSQSKDSLTATGTLEMQLPLLPLSSPPSPPLARQSLPAIEKPKSPCIGPTPATLNFVDRDEMALLGIDADDMAAQHL